MEKEVPMSSKYSASIDPETARWQRRAAYLATAIPLFLVIAIPLAASAG